MSEISTCMGECRPNVHMNVNRSVHRYTDMGTLNMLAIQLKNNQGIVSVVCI